MGRRSTVVAACLSIVVFFQLSSLLTNAVMPEEQRIARRHANSGSTAADRRSGNITIANAPQDAFHSLCVARSAVDQKKPQRKIAVACIGDSITYGNGSHVGKKERDGEGNYPIDLRALLSRCPSDDEHSSPSSSSSSSSSSASGQCHFKFVVKNFGKSGSTVTSRTAKFSYRHTKQYNASIKFKADIVVVMLGTNDAKPRHWTDAATFLSEYIALVRTYTTSGGSRGAPMFVLVVPPPAFPKKQHGGVYMVDDDIMGLYIAPSIAAASERIRAQISAPVLVVDLRAHFKQIIASDRVNVKFVPHRSSGGLRSAYFHDGLHPTALGHHLIAEKIHSVLCEGL